MPSLCCCADYSLVAVHGLLMVVASLVAEHGLWSTGSVVTAIGLSCSVACGIFPDSGSNLCPLLWQGSPYTDYFYKQKRI